MAVMDKKTQCHALTERGGGDVRLMVPEHVRLTAPELHVFARKARALNGVFELELNVVKSVECLVGTRVSLGIHRVECHHLWLLGAQVSHLEILVVVECDETRSTRLWWSMEGSDRGRTRSNLRHLVTRGTVIGKHYCGVWL